MIAVQKLRDTGKRLSFTELFGGYDHNERTNEGTWFDEANMSAELYPVLATRRQRRTVQNLTAPAGMIDKDALAVVDGTKILYNGYEIEMGLSTTADTCPKQLVSMGAYLIVWPDKKYLNTQDFTDKGSFDCSVSVESATVSLCTEDGAAFPYTEGATAPTEPESGARWLDVSEPEVPVLKEWSDTSAMWITIPTVYAKIAASGIAEGFSQYDGVTISGLTGNAAVLNGGNALWHVGTDFIVVVGIVTGGTVSVEARVTVSRTAPEMDYITEAGNRLWGCKYGMVGGAAVNEIYASKLGDFKNWNCFMGLSTDSYAASRGSDGVFTGAATLSGHPLFFKEDCIEKVYPSGTGAHQIVTTEARGVQKGCWRSLAVVGETLYYKSRDGICTYTGALPVIVSQALGNVPYSDARGGAAGSLYYVSMADADGSYHLFTYDTEKRIWHREDGTKALALCENDGEMFYIDETSGTLRGCGGACDGEIDWQVTSGVIGYAVPGNKYVSRFVIRAQTDGGIHLEIRYDDGPWLDKGTYYGNGRLGSFVLPVSPRRCDHLQYRLTGTEACKIYSIAKYAATGSNVMRR